MQKGLITKIYFKNIDNAHYYVDSDCYVFCSVFHNQRITEEGVHVHHTATDELGRISSASVNFFDARETV